jgi:alpha-tubulin suppressor-like RCC1 family protein
LYLDNEYGQLGYVVNGESRQSYIPRRISALDNCTITNIGSGGWYSLFITNNHKLFLCGSINIPEFDVNADCHVTSIPTQPKDFQFEASNIFGTSNRSLIVLGLDDVLYGIGDNNNGLLGVNHALTVPIPEVVMRQKDADTIPFDLKIKSITGGTDKMYILDVKGRVWISGRLENHQSSRFEQVYKSKLGGVRICELKCGWDFVLMRSVSGELFCNKDAPTLERVLPNVPAAMISCGAIHAIVVSTSGQLWGIGTNSYHQMGHRYHSHDDPCLHVNVNEFTQDGLYITDSIACGYDTTIFLQRFKNDMKKFFSNLYRSQQQYKFVDVTIIFK